MGLNFFSLILRLLLWRTLVLVRIPWWYFGKRWLFHLKMVCQNTIHRSDTIYFNYSDFLVNLDLVFKLLFRMGSVLSWQWHKVVDDPFWLVLNYSDLVKMFGRNTSFFLINLNKFNFNIHYLGKPFFIYCFEFILIWFRADVW